MKNILSFVCCISLIGLSIIISCKKKNEPPDIPTKPTGPDSGQVSLTYSFSTTTIDPDDDSISYQFDWGDTVSNWSIYKLSNTTITMSKTWDSAGSYCVRARAMDIKNNTSEWSDSHPVLITERTGGYPTNFEIEAATDTTVKLTWYAPSQGTPDKYIVYFKAIGQPNFINIAEVLATTYTYTHDPQGYTGTYYVSSKFGTNEYYSDIRSTVPIHSFAVSLSELNAAGNSGYGWNRADGSSGTYTMVSPTNVAYVDFYLTDWVSGYSTTPYSIASPDLGPVDPGSVVPAANWRINYISDPLVDPQAPLPIFISNTTYFSITGLNAYPTYLAIRMPEVSNTYYALIKVDGLNIANGTVQVESWFQLIKGLRLISH